MKPKNQMKYDVPPLKCAISISIDYRIMEKISKVISKGETMSLCVNKILMDYFKIK